MPSKTSLYRELKAAAAPYLKLEPPAIADAILADMDELRRLYALPKPHDWKTLSRQKGVEREKKEKQRHLAWRFGEWHDGWQISNREFSLWVLANGKMHAGGSRDYERQYLQGNAAVLDHPYLYRFDGRAASIAAHLYPGGLEWPEQQAQLSAWAEAHELEASFPDFPCWWFPGATRLVVYTRSGNVVALKGKELARQRSVLP